MRRLTLLRKDQYPRPAKDDPLPFYFWPGLGRFYRERVELCLNALPPGGRVLEVGFGSGLMFPSLAEIYDEIFGIDLKAPIHETQAAFKRLGLQVKLIRGDVLRLPYEDNSFEAVLCISILEHLLPQELPRALREINRVLQPQGCLVYGVPVERRLMSMVFRALGYDIRKYHFSSETEVAQAAEGCLTRVGIKTYTPWKGWFGSLYEVGVYKKIPTSSEV